MKAASLIASVLGGIVSTLVMPASAQETKTFDSAGVAIRYVDQGSGAPVVLLHGQGNTLETWIEGGVVQKLTTDYRVIAFDARGHGKSGKPHVVTAYGREMALDALRLMDHLTIPRAHFVGYSQGAHLVQWLLVNHPQRFLTATLGAAVGRIDYTAAQIASDEQEASEREKECVSRSQIIRLAPTNASPPDEATIKKASEACLANKDQDRFAMAAVVRGKKEQAVSAAAVGSVKAPTLGVVGSLDGYVKDFEVLRKLRPDFKVVVVEGATPRWGQGRIAATGVCRRPTIVPEGELTAARDLAGIPARRGGTAESPRPLVAGCVSSSDGEAGIAPNG